MKCSMRNASGFLVVLLFPLSCAHADTLVMKSGDKFSGKIISYVNGLCIFDTQYGAAIKVPTADISGISTDVAYSIDFANGDKVMGQLQANAQGQTVLQSKTFGESSIDVTAISRMVKHFSEVPNTAQAAQAGTAAVNDDKQYGAEVENQAPLDFLTGSTVLLSPGQMELDFNTSYKQSRTQYNLPDVGYFQKSSYSARLLQLSTALRAGLYEGIEGYISVPVTYTRIEDVSSNEYTRDTSAWDLADIAFGGQYQLTRESADMPAISATLDISAPTGRKKYNDQTDSWKDPLNNGTGHWSIAPGLAFVRSTDPAILFGGINYQYFFADKVDGYDVQPGWIINSYFGVGFALNEKLSVGTRLSYSYVSNMKAEHETIYGSDSDPMDISLNASYRLSRAWVVSPGVTFGLNDDSGPAALSLSLKRQL